MINKRLKSESYTIILVIMSLFMVIFFGITKWQAMQTQQENTLYQRQQALQIAENQIALKMAGKACQRLVKQNNLQFSVQCGQTSISVAFPLGEIKIGKP